MLSENGCFTIVSAHNLLILNMVALLDYHQVVARFGCFLECTKVIEIPFCSEVQEVVQPIILFHTLLPKQKFD